MVITIEGLTGIIQKLLGVGFETSVGISDWTQAREALIR
jgi:hypothetical protein